MQLLYKCRISKVIFRPRGFNDGIPKFPVFSYEPRGSRSSLGYGRRPVPVTELEIERERVNLQDELYNLEYEMKVQMSHIVRKTFFTYGIRSSMV